MEKPGLVGGAAAARTEGLLLKRLVKRFGDGSRAVMAVDDVSLEIAPGSFLTLLGPSGCGKTTTLRLIAGFETPTSGQIMLGSRRIDGVPPNERDMAMVFQSYALFPHMTVFENIAYGLRVRRLSEGAIREKVRTSLSLINLEGVEARYPNQLSGGQQQRVALARALVIEPKVLLFDEPLSNLDAKLRVQMRDEIRGIQRRLGLTSIYVTHDQAEAMSLSDTVVVMNRGKVEQVGAPEEVYNRPATAFVADFIGEANFLDATVAAISDGEITADLWGTVIRAASSARTAGLAPGDPLLLVIRPEAVRLVEERDGLAGTVRRAVYTGAAMHYTVDVNGHALSATDTDPTRARGYGEGETVGVRFLDRSFHVLPKER